jgi:NADPH-dependent 2,4-dienoyl-CoA reductase/sulfur reductase-like enzyme
VHAVDHECPHYQCKLEEGLLFGATVVCRCHNARFDVTSGKVMSPPALNDLSVYPVRVENGEVWVGKKEKPRFPVPSGSDPRTFLIVGAGAAGNAASETLRREGFSGRVVMVTPESDPPYDRPNLSKELMAGTGKAEWMPLRSARFYEEAGIELLMGEKVTALDPVKKVATLRGGKAMPFDKALLATGAAARPAGIPGSDGEGCFTLRSFADARAVIAAAEKAKSAALVGAGFIGMEMASSLRERGLAVTVIAREALPLSRVLGDRIATFLKARHASNGVVFHGGKTVVRIEGSAGAKTLVLSDGARVSADFVVFGLGAEPVLDFLQGTGLTKDGGVPVDASLRTVRPDIFAAGDIALVPDPLGGSGVQRVEHWVVAERQGAHAACAMLGSARPYSEAQFFWTRQTGIGVKYVGYAREWDHVEYRGSEAAGKLLAGFYEGGVLKAAAGVGLPNDIGAVERILTRRIALPAERFSDERADLSAIARD